MYIYLIDRNPHMVEAWKTIFGGSKIQLRHEETGGVVSIDIKHGNILDLVCDAIVSPANSFGFMDGGIDQAYTDHFGPELQKNLQGTIDDREYRHLFTASRHELLVGDAVSVGTNDDRIKYLISAPTMRVPMTLPPDTINPYLATRAAVGLAKRHKLSVIAMPGMGAGCGNLRPLLVAHQMAVGIECGFAGEKMPQNWHEARQAHDSLLRPVTLPSQCGSIRKE